MTNLRSIAGVLHTFFLTVGIWTVRQHFVTGFFGKGLPDPINEEICHMVGGKPLRGPPEMKLLAAKEGAVSTREVRVLA